ncbi:MAG: signal peptidase II [Chloroflexota bacterium]
MKKFVRDYSILALVSGIVIGLDQITKSIIRQNLAIGEMWMPLEWLAPYARIVHWYNRGAVFGLFQGFGEWFALLAIIIALAIIYYYPRIPAEDWALRAAMGLQLGGAVGNLIDRLTIGHVTDFFSVGNFPVFNVADSSITIGVVVLIVGVWLQERREKQARQAADANEIHEPVDRVNFRQANE